MPIVKLPDGKQVKFPDDMPTDEIRALIKEHYPDAVKSLKSGKDATATATPAVEAATPPEAAPQAAAPPAAPAAAAQPSLGGSVLATGSGLVDSIPFVGPLVTKGSDFLLSQTLGRLEGKDPAQFMAEAEQSRQATNDANPIAHIAGEVGGAIGGYGAAGLTKVGSEALGLAGKSLVGRATNSGLSTLGMTEADNIARGEKPTDALNNSLVSGAVGAATPLVAKGVAWLGRALTGPAAKTINGIFNQEGQANRLVSKAFQRDAEAGAPMMNSLDEANAAINGQPVLNADRGGSNIRTLARTAANMDPSAAGKLQGVTSDRFAQQGNRAVEFLKRVTGGAVDDLAYRQSIKDMARAVNKPAYDKAFNSGLALSVWTPEIRDLMQSDTFRKAISAAESRGTDKAAVAGGKAVRNPFIFRADGSVTLKTNADGSRALPSLQFWDQVKRNLDSEIGKAQRAGDNALMSDLTQMKTKLTGTLDQAVPDYAKARAGASAFFGAEEAIDAGKQFALQPKSIPEARQAFMKFAPAEKQAFATGYASELIDKIKASRDRVNVINQVFGSQASREQAQLALGEEGANALEAFVRVENILQETNTAVRGNSSTAQQLIAAGLIGGGVGAYTGGGDIRNVASMAALFAAGRVGMRAMGAAVDKRVMERVADILVSGDRTKIDAAIVQAGKNKQRLQALQAIGRGMDITAKGSIMAEHAVAAN